MIFISFQSLWLEWGLHCLQDIVFTTWINMEIRSSWKALFHFVKFVFDFIFIMCYNTYIKNNIILYSRNTQLTIINTTNVWTLISNVVYTVLYVIKLAIKLLWSFIKIIMNDPIDKIIHLLQIYKYLLKNNIF